MTIRQLESVFCDFVRTENTDKKIYVGVYGQKLLVPNFPAKLPTLSVLLALLYDKPSTPQESVIFRVFMDEEVIAEGIVDGAMLERVRELTAGTPEESLGRLGAEFNFSPFEVEGPCVLRVRVFVDGEEIRGAGLVISSGVMGPSDGSPAPV